MKLFYSPSSPFVRKVLVLAHEAGIADRLETVLAVVNPVAHNQAVQVHNPTGHIPTLLLEDGTALYDSTVICEYLDTLHSGRPFIPAEPALRIRTRLLQTLAEGVLTAGVLMRFEAGLRPKELFWPEWYEGQRAKVRNSLAHLERDWVAHLQGPVDVGVITAACALGYVDFRFPDDDWRDAFPQLADWYRTFAERPSMQATQHSAIVN